MSYFPQMDALIATFVDELKQRVAMYNEDPDGNLFNDVSSTEADGEDFIQYFDWLRLF
jgi:hypothetical protein